jgi:fibronectin type 3 domain-containing protein
MPVLIPISNKINRLGTAKLSLFYLTLTTNSYAIVDEAEAESLLSKKHIIAEFHQETEVAAKHTDTATRETAMLQKENAHLQDKIQREEQRRKKRCYQETNRINKYP